MLERPFRQLFIVCATLLVALIPLLTVPTNLGPDLKGGVQLTYDIPEERLQEQERATGLDRTGLMEQTLRIIRERIDPNGVLEAQVSRRGETGILIELGAMAEAELKVVERRIETLGKLEFRLCAYDEWTNFENEEETLSFNLDEEVRRLEAWLEGSDRMERAKEDPVGLIREYNALSAEQQGSESQWIRWYTRKVKPSPEDPNRWDFSLTGSDLHTVVQAYAPEELQSSPTAETAPEFLPEFMAINMKSRFFEGSDLNPAATSVGTDDRGKPAVNYQMSDEVADAYAAFSDEYTDSASAILLNDEVVSAPRFDGRIYGNAQIHGSFTRTEAESLVQTLRTGSLKVEPIRQSKRAIGAKLGAESVNRGIYSIIAGGVLVLLFTLWYYRLAGLVACTGVLLNVIVLMGVLHFVRATLTLPGIAGIVLTVGMAVDANILIYERIREELKKGKDMLQACRTGFDKAIVTILDANVTTLLAGIVLFNVGVGPIRGFAVTLIAGILTTLFTAFFVTRLVFHYLLAKQKLSSLNASSLVSGTKFNFVSRGRVALVLSGVLIIGGLAYTSTIPAQRLLGLDFTGGANIEVVLKEPLAAQTVRDMLDNQQLSTNKAFADEFLSPQVNTTGEVDGDGKAKRIGIKVKLTDAQNTEISEARQEAKKSDQDYTPPYVARLEELFADKIVAEAYSDERLLPSTNETLQIAELQLHFTNPVSVSALNLKLKDGGLPEVEVIPVGEAQSGGNTDFKVSWTEDISTEADELFARVDEAIQGNDEDDRLLDVNGEEVQLSSPFPEAEEIGGRMVGELRNAAIGALVLSLFLIVMFIRIRFHEYKYGIAAVAALVHDVLMAFGILAVANHLGLIDAELNLAMIAAFLTIIGYSINDTIVVFDRLRENLRDQEKLGGQESFGALANRAINQTLSRTLLTSGTTLFVVLAQFFVNYGSGSVLEGFSFALILGVLTGTYSTMFVATPLVVWLRAKGIGTDTGEESAQAGSGQAPAA